MLTPEEQELKIKEKLDKYILAFDKCLAKQTEFPITINCELYDEMLGYQKISFQYKRLLRQHYQNCGWLVKPYCQCSPYSNISQNKIHKLSLSCNKDNDHYFNRLQFSFPGLLSRLWRNIIKYILRFFEPKLAQLPPRKTAYRD